MPLAFPGMDPYLEGSLWTTLHFGLSAEIVRQLAPKLRPRYLALPVERFIMDTPDSVVITTANIYPDVGVVTSQTRVRETAATWSTDAPLQIATVVPSEVPHVTIEIRDVDDRQLVTAIELLSPTNKHGKSYEKYVTKRQRLSRAEKRSTIRNRRKSPLTKRRPSGWIRDYGRSDYGREQAWRPYRTFVLNGKSR